MGEAMTSNVCPRWLRQASAMLLAWCLCWSVGQLRAEEAAPLAEDPVAEARMLAIAQELRCLVCQNQTVADSHSGLAIDLRREIRTLLKEGKSDQAVRDYMTARYGDFILYRPRVTGSTALLWFGPAILLVVGLVALWAILRQRARMSPAAFDPETPDTPEL
jgi:cytochrome c-type biogenesis protein CcmH